MLAGVHCGAIYNSRSWKQHKGPSIDEWMKMWDNEVYSATKNNEMLPFAAT